MKRKGRMRSYERPTPKNDAWSCRRGHRRTCRVCDQRPKDINPPLDIKARAAFEKTKKWCLSAMYRNINILFGLKVLQFTRLPFLCGMYPLGAANNFLSNRDAARGSSVSMFYFTSAPFGREREMVLCGGCRNMWDTS
jgi:hypothetical protein